jgi:hypothetical protein
MNHHIIFIWMIISIENNPGEVLKETTWKRFLLKINLFIFYISEGFKKKMLVFTLE